MAVGSRPTPDHRSSSPAAAIQPARYRSRGRAGRAAAMEVDLLGDRAHRRGRKREIDEANSAARDRARAEQPLSPESREFAREARPAAAGPPDRRWSATREAARRPWRKARRMPPPVIGDTQPAASPMRRTPVGGDPRQSGPPQGMRPLRRPTTRMPLQRKTDSVRRHEGGEVGLGAVARRKAELDRVRARRRPGDIARCQPRIDEAMQEALIEAIVRLELDLDAGQELAGSPRRPKCRATRERAPSAPMR